MELNVLINCTEASFIGWFFGLIIFFYILNFLCKPLKNSNNSIKKWEREYKILHEQGIFGVNLDNDHRLAKSPLFHCYSEYYQKAFDLIFNENQETTTINGVQYVFKRNIKAIKIFEQITNRRFSLNENHDLYILMYSLLLANNESLDIRIDDFLIYAQKGERCIESRKPRSRHKQRKKHIPSILMNRTPGVQENKIEEEQITTE